MAIALAYASQTAELSKAACGDWLVRQLVEAAQANQRVWTGQVRAYWSRQRVKCEAAERKQNCEFWLPEGCSFLVLLSS